MALGRQGERQADPMLSWAELPRSLGHAFYDRLQAVLIEAGFDGFAILSHTSEPPALALRGDPTINTLLGPVRPPCTVLCRTNAGLFEAAIRGRDRIHIVGGLEPLARLILGGWQLYQGQQVPDLPSLARFRSWDELLEEADEARDPELRFLVQIIVHYGRALPGLVADLRRRVVPHPAAAERVGPFPTVVSSAAISAQPRAAMRVRMSSS